MNSENQPTNRDRLKDQPTNEGIRVELDEGAGQIAEFERWEEYEILAGGFVRLEGGNDTVIVPREHIRFIQTEGHGNRVY